MEFLLDNYITFVLLIGFMTLLFTRDNIKTKDNKIFRIVLVEIAMLTIVDHLEYYYSELAYENVYRYIYSTLAYTLRPLILLLLINMLTKNKKIIILYIALIINLLLCATTYHTHLVYHFGETNSFSRGLLGYFPHILLVIYLVIFVYLIIKKFPKQSDENRIHLGFIISASVVAIVLEMYHDTLNIFNNTLLITLLFYYLFIFMQYTKVDNLTELLNRQSFFNDMNNHNLNITAVLSIDMNGLKLINDTYGHTAGDKALTTISKIMKKYSNKRFNFYRVGGDEFTCLCFNQKEENVKKLIKKIKDDLKKTGYSCSIGYSMADKNQKLYEAYKLADIKMYKEKEKYYVKNKKQDLPVETRN